MDKLPTIAALLWFLVICWAASGLGGYLLRTLKIESANPLRDLCLRLASGFAILSFLTTIAGHLDLWCPIGSKIGFAILALAAIPSNLAFIRRIRATRATRLHYSFEQTLLIIGICAIWVLLMMNSLGPIINFDAERYHYLMPKLFLQHGSFYKYPANPFPAYPMSIEMLFLDGFSLAGQQVASLIDWTLGLLLILTTIEFCNRHLDLTTGLLTVVIFSGIAFFQSLVGSGYIDISVAAFMLIGMYALIDWFSSKRTGDAFLAGLLLATAVSGKYYALLWIGFLAIGVLWHLIRSLSIERKQLLRGIGLIVVIIIILAIPWYGRNIFIYHNPFYPFLNQLFTGQRVLGDDITTWAGPKIYPKTIANFVRYLPELTFLDIKAEGLHFSRNYFHPFFCLFPLFGLLALRKPFARWCYIYSWLFTIYAFLLIPFQTRYFLPYEMLMAVCVASGMKFLSRRRPILIIFIVLALIPLGIEFNDAREEFIAKREVVLDNQNILTYLGSRVFDYQVFKYADEELSDESRILYLRERTFYLDVDYTVIEPRLNFDDARHPDEMLQKLRELGYTHVMVEMDTVETLNVLDAIFDELPYSGPGGIVGEGDLRYVEFSYWAVVANIGEQRDLRANVLPAIIDVLGGELIGNVPKAEKYRLDLAPFRDRQYLVAYASLASELNRWYADGVITQGYFAGNTRLYDIRERDIVKEESEYDEKNEEDNKSTDS